MNPEIEAVNRDYCDAYNAGDVEKLLTFLTDDALTLSPDQAPVRGRAAHREYMAAGIRREVLRRLSLESIRSERFGELIYDSGQWTNTMTSADGSEQSARGFYLTVYRRERERWAIVATTFNIAPS
jgi:uncharacterized protein (TIGR02246 family)